MNYNIINHKFECNNCGQCSFPINNPIIYKDLSYNNLMKIVSNLTLYGHTSKTVLQSTEIKCNGTINVICTTVGSWEALSINKSIIKEILEIWCYENNVSYISPTDKEQKIIGIIYILDLIGKYSTFRDIMSSLSFSRID